MRIRFVLDDFIDLLSELGKFFTGNFTDVVRAELDHLKFRTLTVVVLNQRDKASGVLAVVEAMILGRPSPILTPWLRLRRVLCPSRVRGSGCRPASSFHCLSILCWQRQRQRRQQPNRRCRIESWFFFSYFLRNRLIEIRSIKSLLTFSRGSKTDQRRLNTHPVGCIRRVYAGSGYGCFPEKLYFLIHQELKSRTVFQAIRCNFLPVSEPQSNRQNVRRNHNHRCDSCQGSKEHRCL